MKKIDITPQELCERLFKGESFYDECDHRLYYENGVFKKQYPDEGRTRVDISKWFTRGIYTKHHWTDNLSKENPVLCKAIGDITGNEHFVLICEIQHDGVFVDSNNNYWSNAEPVKIEDAYIWSDE